MPPPLSLALVFVITFPFVYSDRRCKIGDKLYSVTRIRVKDTTETTLFPRCRRLQPPECERECEWAASCRATQSWHTYKRGARSYVAGVRRSANGMELYCCATMAMSIERCSFSTPLIENRQMLHLTALQLSLDFKVHADTVIRDIISVIDKRSSLMKYSVEICSLKRERPHCDLEKMKGENKHKFKVLMLRRARPKAFPSKGSEVDLLRYNLFTTTPRPTPPRPPPNPFGNRGSKTTPPPPTRKPKRPSKESNSKSSEKVFHSRGTNNSALTTPRTTTGPKEVTWLPNSPQPEHKTNLQQCPKRDWTPCIDVEEANYRYTWCCASLGVAPGCVEICKYNLHRNQVTQAIQSGRCPSSQMSDVMKCASEYKDVTTCCHVHGVFEDGRGFCRPFCNPAAHNLNFSDLRNLPCAQQAEVIVQCFRAYQQP